MIESDQVMYVARTPAPLSVDELTTLTRTIPDPHRLVETLIEKGYRIIGFTSGLNRPAMMNVEGELLPQCGAEPGDIVVAGSTATLLFPKSRLRIEEAIRRRKSAEVKVISELTSRAQSGESQEENTWQ